MSPSLAKLAGVSKPMIYTYLGTKNDLFTACIHRVQRPAVRVTRKPSAMGTCGIAGG